jgi:hypothetical protein
MPVWEENNRNDIAAGRTKTPVIRPILIDRELPMLTAKLDELNKAAGLDASGPGTLGSAPQPGGPSSEGTGAKPQPPDLGTSALTADQKKEFIDLTNRIKLLTDRRNLILARAGEEYVTAPPKLKP